MACLYGQSSATHQPLETHLQKDRRHLPRRRDVALKFGEKLEHTANDEVHHVNEQNRGEADAEVEHVFQIPATNGSRNTSTKTG